MNLYQIVYYAIRLNQNTFGVRKGSDFFCGVTGNLIDRGKLVVFSYSELTATISRGRQKAAPCVQNSDREAANLMPSNNVIAVIKAARETKTVGDALKLAVEVQHEHIDPVLVSLDAEIDHLDRYGKAQESRRCKVFRWALNGHVVFDVLGLAEHLDCII